MQGSRPLKSLRSRVGVGTAVTCGVLLKLLMTLLENLWLDHHARISLSCIVKRCSVDATCTGWIVIDRGILHLRSRSCSRIFQPVHTLC